MVPTLEYHNQTWTYLDLLMAMKADCKKVLISQVRFPYLAGFSWFLAKYARINVSFNRPCIFVICDTWLYAKSILVISFQFYSTCTLFFSFAAPMCVLVHNHVSSAVIGQAIKQKLHMRNRVAELVDLGTGGGGKHSDAQEEEQNKVKLLLGQQPSVRCDVLVMTS